MLYVWFFQLLLDAAFVALAFAYVLQKRRLLTLEAQLQIKLMDLEQLHSKLNADSARGPSSTLSERSGLSQDDELGSQAPQAAPGLSTASRYAFGQRLLAQGVSLREVSRRSGISEAELSLLKKFLDAPKNSYESH